MPLPAGDENTAAQESLSVALEEEMADLVVTRYLYEANAKTVKIADEVIGEFLHIEA